jgi:hypothetical protein
MSADIDSSPASRRSFVLAAAASGLSSIVPSVGWAQQEKPQRRHADAAAVSRAADIDHDCTYGGLVSDDLGQGHRGPADL